MAGGADSPQITHSDAVPLHGLTREEPLSLTNGGGIGNADSMPGGKVGPLLPTSPPGFFLSPMLGPHQIRGMKRRVLDLYLW
jgi:hypothetical protein